MDERFDHQESEDKQEMDEHLDRQESEDDHEMDEHMSEHEPAYRILLSKDAESGKMVAVVPELKDCNAEGETYKDALHAVEERIRDILIEMNEEGLQSPVPIDEREYEPILRVELSPWLHRELDWQSVKENMDKDRIVSEILADGLARRNWKRHGKRRGGHGGQGGHGRRDGGRRGGRRDGMSKDKYMGIMEDRASFIEYVRGLDSGGSGGGGGGRGKGGKRQE